MTMDLNFTEDQESVRDLARQIFHRYCSDERLRQLERDGTGFDADLWAELARAHLLAFGISEDDGGNGGGIVELCLLLEQAGRAAAAVPLWGALVLGALPIARFGNPEQRRALLSPMIEGGPIVTAALAEPGTQDPFEVATSARTRGSTWVLEGTKVHVPAADRAARVIVPARAKDVVVLFLVDPSADGVVRHYQPNASGEPLSMLELKEAEAELLTDDVEALPWFVSHAAVGLCAWQVGIADQALRLTAGYTSGREQFGRPLASFQAVQQRAADAFIDIEAMRWTMWHAAWKLSTGSPAEEEVAVAKYWAAEGGHRALAAAQHLHGGVGVDMEYPLHRYTFLEKQVELTLGGATFQLARLGAAMARA
jgi:3-oxocholest-4-en-26-oyl-CoA dehydrogenase beta subunit